MPLVVLLLVIAVIISGTVWLAIAFLGGDPVPARPATPIDYEQYRAGWESAMSKAGVETTWGALEEAVKSAASRFKS